MKKKNVWTKVKTPMEKFGMFGKEEGFTRVKDLLWEWEKDEEDVFTYIKRRNTKRDEKV